jgi:hypothetical protein
MVKMSQPGIDRELLFMLRRFQVDESKTPWMKPEMARENIAVDEKDWSTRT